MSDKSIYRVLITGSRNWKAKYDCIIQSKLDDINRDYCYNKELVVVHGDCPSGVDFIAKMFCSNQNIKQEKYPAKWNTHGKKAGMIRNQQMVETKPDYCIAFWDGASPGTKHCFTRAIKAGIPTDIFVRQRCSVNT